MTAAPPRHPGYAIAGNFLASPKFSAALTHTIIGAELAALFFQELMGWGGAIGILGALVILASLSLFAQRRLIEWHGLLPISLLIFVGWAAVSIFWSQYQWASFASILYLLAVTTLGIYVALVRDTIQIVRAFGDVLRVGLTLSMMLEIFAGLLIDAPIHFFNIQGNLDIAGPIQGIFGTRDELGIVALVALVTFGIELRTRSVSRGITIGSLILAGFALLFTRSPIAFGSLIVTAVAVLALYSLRRARPEHKRIGQFSLLASTIAIGALAWAVRTPLIDALSASNELNKRLALWQPIRLLISEQELQGWGWVGTWRQDIFPFLIFPNADEHTPASALNAYLDVWFQLGIIGLCAFVMLVALAFIRSWLLASRQRSVVYTWPALVLVVLLFTGLAESSTLVEFGWLTLVVCSVKAARELSWRRAFAATAPAPTPAD